jgi:hypothetical protein
VLAHRFRLPFGFRRFAHRSTSGRFQTRVARRRTIGSGKSGSPVKRIAFRRVVPRSSATSARPRRFLPSAFIPSKMVSQRLDRLRWSDASNASARGPCARETSARLKSAPFHAKQHLVAPEGVHSACARRQCRIPLHARASPLRTPGLTACKGLDRFAKPSYFQGASTRVRTWRPRTSSSRVAVTPRIVRCRGLCLRAGKTTNGGVIRRCHASPAGCNRGCSVLGRPLGVAGAFGETR